MKPHSHQIQQQQHQQQQFKHHFTIFRTQPKLNFYLVRWKDLQYPTTTIYVAYFFHPSTPKRSSLAHDRQIEHFELVFCSKWYYYFFSRSHEADISLALDSKSSRSMQNTAVCGIWGSFSYDYFFVCHIYNNNKRSSDATWRCYLVKVDSLVEKFVKKIRSNFLFLYCSVIVRRCVPYFFEVKPNCDVTKNVKKSQAKWRWIFFFEFCVFQCVYDFISSFFLLLLFLEQNVPKLWAHALKLFLFKPRCHMPFRHALTALFWLFEVNTMVWTNVTTSQTQCSAVSECVNGVLQWAFKTFFCFYIS